MKSAVLNFSRPEQLQATVPPEARGLERDEVRLLVTTPDGNFHRASEICLGSCRRATFWLSTKVRRCLQASPLKVPWVRLL